jgi:hypothetical protein
MKVPVAVGILIVGLLAASTVHGQSGTITPPNFQVEIQPTGDRGPMFTVTNLSGKTVTACFIEISSSSDNRDQSKIDWDAIVLGRKPLESGASISLPLSHVVGGPLPDKVGVVAGIWADGETFGSAELVRRILVNREMRGSDYNQAIAFLQQGLDANWTRDQYLAALKDRANSGSFQMIKSNLEKNEDLGDKPERLQRIVKRLIGIFEEDRDSQRQPKPGESVAAKPQAP